MGAAMRAELATTKPRPEQLHLAPALNLAGELLTKNARPGERRELVIITDLQRSNWANADFGAVPPDTFIEIEAIGPARPLDNLAILSAGAVGRLEDGRDTRFEVEVGNYSAGAREVNVEIALEKALYRLSGVCPPGATRVLATEVPLHGSGWQIGEARLVDNHDALSWDDRRSFVLHLSAAPVYALITRQPAQQKATSSYFLERALAPSAGFTKGATPRVERAAPSRLDADKLAEAATLVLDHPGKLNAEAVKTLADLLRRGRGLLYCLAETDDAYNVRALADAMGAAWQAPVEFLPPAAGQRRRDLFYVDVRRGQIPFAVFGDELANLTGSLRFSGGLPTRRLARGLADDILATYSDQSAGLVVTPCAAGTVALWNADLSTSNLPASPAFVPLVSELALRLASQWDSGASFACGQTVSLPLPPSSGPRAGLRAVGPDGKPAGELTEESTGVVWRSPRETVPGVYRVVRGSETVFAGAAFVPPEEADLRPLAKDVLHNRLVGGRQVHVSVDAGDEPGVDICWTWLAAICLLAMIGEVVVLRMFHV